MGHQPGAPPDQRKIERAVVLQVLRDDHSERWSETELATTLNEEPSSIAAAVERLQDSGVLLVDADVIVASPCARKIDALGVIGI